MGGQFRAMNSYYSIRKFIISYDIFKRLVNGPPIHLVHSGSAMNSVDGSGETVKKLMML